RHPGRTAREHAPSQSRPGSALSREALMPTLDPVEVVVSMPDDEHRSWLRTLAPDDDADLIQSASKRIGLRFSMCSTRVRVAAATASAPPIATLVDVSGLVIYFSVAKFSLEILS